jgi:hypothetical protein
MNLSEITLALFTLFNLLRLGCYIPQIASIAVDTGGARAISCSAWGVWMASHLTTASYAIVNVTDWPLFMVSTVNTLGCGIVVTLTLWKRRKFISAGSVA